MKVVLPVVLLINQPQDFQVFLVDVFGLYLSYELHDEVHHQLGVLVEHALPQLVHHPLGEVKDVVDQNLITPTTAEGQRGIFT